jgi:hypothetical protein
VLSYVTEKKQKRLKSTNTIVVNVFGGGDAVKVSLVGSRPRGTSRTELLEGGRMMATLSVKTQQTPPAVVPQQLLTMRHMWIVWAHNTQRLVCSNCNRNGNLGSESRYESEMCERHSLVTRRSADWLPPCPFLSGLFNDTVTKSHYIALKNCMAVNDELEKIWNEAGVTWL